MRKKARLTGWMTSLACALALSAARPASADRLNRQILMDTFVDTFVSGYEAARCGDNVVRLIRAARNRGMNLEGAEIVSIENAGYSVFGMINAERARESGRLIRGATPGGPSHEAGEQNWYHHVVLTYDGLVFDSSFENEPRVLEIGRYFEEMFLVEEPNRGQGGTFFVGREQKLKDYQIQIHDALARLSAIDQRRASPSPRTLRLGTYLEQVGPR